MVCSQKIQESIIQTKCSLDSRLNEINCLEKPIINEKILSRPPFPFIHTVIKFFVEQLDFSVGLYTAIELQSAPSFSRQDKVRFD